MRKALLLVSALAMACQGFMFIPGSDGGTPGNDGGAPPGNDGGSGNDGGTPPGNDGGSGYDGGGGTPIEQHLSWTGNPATSVDVVWSDTNATAEVVRYGTSGAYGSTVAEAAAPYTVPGESVYSHHVALTGLTPGTQYHYASGGAGDHTFTTATGPSLQSNWSFTAWGDQGVTATLGTGGGGCGVSTPGGSAGVAGVPEATPKQAAASGADLGVYLGDCSYANGSGSSPWDAWYAANSALSADHGWLVTVGNHDEPVGQGPGTALDGENFYNRLFFPSPFKSSANVGWWSTDYNGVHFIFLSGDQYGSSAQTTWLNADLSSSAAQSAAWRIVLIHQPPFSSSCYGNDPYEVGARNTFVPIFQSYAATAHVDLVLQGHRHVYERTHVLTFSSGTITADTAAYNAATNTYTLPAAAGVGTIYVTAGGGGHDLHGWESSQPSWSANRRSFYSWLKFNVSQTSIAVEVHDTQNAGSIWETFTVAR